MKFSHTFFLLFFLLSVLPSYADTSEPMFAGTSLDIPTFSSTPYEWDSATEDGTTHTDTYIWTGRGGGPYYVTVTGFIAFPNVAMVTGVRGDLVIDSYLQNEGWGEILLADRVQTSTTTTTTPVVTVNNRAYTGTATTTTTYSISPTTGLITSDTVVAPGSTYNAAGGYSFTIEPDATLSGSETGFYLDGQFYVNSLVEENTDLTLSNGHHYIKKNLHYSRDGSGQLIVTGYYSNQDLWLYLNVASDGVLSGSETGYRINGNWYVNGPVETDVDYTSPDGRNYTHHHVDVQYTKDSNGQVVQSIQNEYYYNESGFNFYLQSDGTITGNESGVVVNDTWYMDYLHDTTTTDYVTPDGQHFTSHSLRTVYTADGNGGVNSSDWDYYSIPGSPTYFTIDPLGNIGGYLSGVLVNGTWYLNTNTSTDVDLTLPNGHHYTTHRVYTAYSLDGNGGVTTTVYNMYDPPSGGTLNVSSTGQLSGTEAGYWIDDTWYLNSSSEWSGVDYTTPSGHHFGFYYTGVSYDSLDESGHPVANNYKTYWDNGVAFTINGDGTITGSESGYEVNGTLYFNGPFTSFTTASSGASSFSLFGSTYTFSFESGARTYDSSGNITSLSYTDHYWGANGSTAQITSSWTAGENPVTPVLSGSDVYAGSFSTDYASDLSTVTWPSRTDSSFTWPVLYLNGTLLNWQSGTIDSAGVVTDTYGQEGSGQSLVISGSLHDFRLNTHSPDVSLNGTKIGIFSSSEYAFILSGADVEYIEPNTNTPFFTGTTVWVDSTPYPFTYGYADGYGHRTDVYRSSSGTVRLVGDTNLLNTVHVQVNHNGDIHTGYASFGGGGVVLYLSGVNFSTVKPENVPAAFWVGDVFYLRTATSTFNNNTYHSFPTAGSTLTLGGTTSAGTAVLGSLQDGSALTGTFDPAAGAFTLTQQDGTPLNACPAQADGRHIPVGTAPENYPPAIHVQAEVWGYLGTAIDDGATSATAAYYGNTRNPVFDTSGPLIPGDHRKLLKIRLGGSGVVTLTNYGSDNATGTYSTATQLFQTGTTASLPMPIYGVDPNASDTPWQLLTPPAGNATPGNGPPALLVGGHVWRYAGLGPNGSALYQGGYNGQQLTLGTPDTTNPDGNRTVTITDPIAGVSEVSGTFNDVRGTVRLADGTELYSGNTAGQQLNPTLNPGNLHTIDADLDVTGNVITFGALTGNTATAAVTLQFQDLGSNSAYTASFNSILARPQAQWLWSRTASSNGQPTVPVMKLDASSKLSLYDPTDSTTATVKLSPKTDQVSELPQLKLNNQTLDDTDGTSTHVLTRSLADNRYLRTSGSGQNLALNGSINVNTGTNSTTNTLPGDANAVAIGQNLQAGSGQVVVGKYNTGTPSSDVFVVGAGSDSTKKDALTVSSSGNTVVNGDLSVTGTTTLANATVSGTLSVAGSTVLTQGTGTSAYLTSGQIATDYYRKDATTFNFGIDSWAGNSGSMALGPQARAKGGEDPSFAMGRGAVAGISSTEVGITLPNGLVAGEGGGATAIGLGAYATYYAIALGNYSRATGGSTALGNGSNALAWNSVALGGGQAEGPGSLALGSRAFTSASAESSAAIGFNVFASGTRAMALGTDSNAIGLHSMALNGAWARAENSVGIGSTVHTFYLDEVVVGTYPEAPLSGVATERQPTDPLFVVGNGSGTGSTSNSNALVVRRNGNAEVKANFSVGKNAAVTEDLSVTGNTTLASATVSGTLSVAGSAVLTQAAAATTYATQTSLDSTNTTVSTVITNLASTNTTVAGLTTNLASTNTAVSGLTTNLASANSAVSTLTTDLASTNTAVAGLTTNLASTNTAVSGLTTNLASTNTAVSGLTTNLASANSAVSTLTTDLASTNTAVAGLTTNLASTNTAVAGHTTTISGLLSKTEASNTYLAKDDAGTTYLKINDAQTDYYRVNQPLVVPNTTTLNGSLTATQASRFQASFVVEGQKENPADPANRKVIAKPDQEVLVPEQGDISMGEFRAGTLPASN